jgi:hypothetical protein
VTGEWWPDGGPAVGDLLASDLAARAMPTIDAAVNALLRGHNMTAADDILNIACREAIAAYKIGRRVDRRVPVEIVAKHLRLAAEAAVAVLPTSPLHLGAMTTREGHGPDGAPQAVPARVRRASCPRAA